MIEITISILQIVIGLLVLNVWSLRRRKPSPWRGGDAKNMRQEFKEYGLPMWFMKTVKWVKISLALLLLAGVWLPVVTKPAAIGMGLLMIGAIAMHFKINDPIHKSYPASLMLIACFTVAAT